MRLNFIRSVDPLLYFESMHFINMADFWTQQCGKNMLILEPHPTYCSELPHRSSLKVALLPHSTQPLVKMVSSATYLGYLGSTSPDRKVAGLFQGSEVRKKGVGSRQQSHTANPISHFSNLPLLLPWTYSSYHESKEIHRWPEGLPRITNDRSTNYTNLLIFWLFTTTVTSCIHPVGKEPCHGGGYY